MASNHESTFKDSPEYRVMAEAMRPAISEAFEKGRKTERLVMVTLLRAFADKLEKGAHA